MDTNDNKYEQRQSNIQHWVNPVPSVRPQIIQITRRLNEDWLACIEDHMHHGIQHVLAAVFQRNIAPYDTHVLHENLEPLVHFAYMQELCQPTVLKTNNVQLQNLQEDWTALAAYLRREAKASLLLDTQTLAGILRVLTFSPERLRLSACYLFLLGSWELVKALPVTYWVLSDLTTLANRWQCPAEQRKLMVQLMYQIQCRWDAESES